MAAEIPHRGLRILSLDGGGVRGLSTLQILEYLMKSINARNPPKPCDVFDMIGGTSTGGLIAIMLGRLRMTVSEAIDAYLELSSKVFEPKHPFNFLATLANLSQAKGTCDTAALESSIKKVTIQKLGKGKEDELLFEENLCCHIFVCAVRADRRSLINFRNYSAEGTADLQPKIWEAARATSAATTFFDPITIGKYGQTFVDGGGGYNNPIQQVYEEAISCWKNRAIECIVSIGTGQVSLKAFGKNLKQVGQTLIDIATDTDEKASLFARNHPQFDKDGAEKRLFRLQVAQGLETVGMAEHKKIKEIASATQVYMENVDRAGCKQLKLFKALVAGTRSVGPNIKFSSVPLEPEKVRYIEKFADMLEFQSPQLILPNETKIHVHDLWIEVPCLFQGRPLVHLMVRPNTAFAPYDRAWIPSENFAIAMCGGQGLAPDQTCSKTLYSSREAGWDLIKTPMAFAFTVIPPRNRCYFTEQCEWVTERCVRMLDVCHYLWDHADAIDLDENQVPVKVLFEDVRGDLNSALGGIRSLSQIAGWSWKFRALDDAVQTGLLPLLQSADADSMDFVEIEDAVDLLMKSNGYTASDKTFWDEDGTNRIVDDWVGRFGPSKARWIALDMTIKLMMNVDEALVLPHSFSPLLHTGSGTCFIVWWAGNY